MPVGGGMREQLPGTRGIDLAREALGRAVSERDFMGQVVDYARLSGWRAYHTYDSRRCEPGFPDLVLVRGNRLVFAELKTRTGRLEAEQLEWLGALDMVDTVESTCWRPDDWAEIEEVLKR